MKDNRTYYDEFAAGYEDQRHHGYHVMLDELEIGVARPLCEGKDVLEVGCGTGLILRRLAEFSRSAVGIDLSPGMLEKARARGLDVVEGSATDLPFEDGTFDAVCSFKVLAHVEDIEQAMREVARVLRPGGRAVLEFYNRRSLRYLVKRMKTADAISAQSTDHDVFTRYDDLEDVARYLPANLKIDEVRGVRVFTPFAQLHGWPVVGSALRWLERVARDNPLTRGYGGFLVVVLTRTA